MILELSGEDVAFVMAHVGSRMLINVLLRFELRVNAL